MHCFPGFRAVAFLSMIASAGMAPQVLAENAEGSKKIEFKHALTDKPIEFKYRKSQKIGPEVESFYQTGINPFSGDKTAIAAGKKVYKKLCQACHLKDGKGRIGPNLRDENWIRKRTDTEVGRFEIIYGGGAGAMQAFGRRIDQDDILKVMVFIDTFRLE